MGDYIGEYYRVAKGDTRSFDHGVYGVRRGFGQSKLTTVAKSSLQTLMQAAEQHGRVTSTTSKCAKAFG